jgi:hypothetical protein
MQREWRSEALADSDDFMMMSRLAAMAAAH